MADTPLNLHALTLDAIQQLDFSGSAWAKQMESIIARGHMAAQIAGITDRSGVEPKGLSRIERQEIKAIIKEQLDYHRRFVEVAPDMSPEARAARAALYAGAVRQTYYAERWGAWDIPQHLLPGNQTCMTNCKCRISVEDHGDGTGTLTREMGGTEAHCDECPALVGSYDVKRQKL